MALRSPREKFAFAGELLFPPNLAEENGMLPRIKSWTAHLLTRIG